MNEGGFPISFAIIITAVIVSVFGLVGLILSKVLVGF
jgi:hypothetical protein